MGGLIAIRDLDFEATAELEPGASLRLSGTADGGVVSQLSSLLEDMHAQLVAAKTAEVTVDIRTLDFMNASCFNVIVGWLDRIQLLPPSERYQLRFAINPAIPWQCRSLRTLACFATDLVQVVD
jgi:hypothetical protein